MTAKRTARWRGLAALIVILIVIGVVLSLLFTSPANPSQGQDNLLTAEQAKMKGLAEARIAGLVGEPTSVNATLTDLEDYTRVSTFGTGSLGADAGNVGWHPDKEIWVITFEGTVKMTLPSSGGETYDNITIALDAQTGEIIGTDAYPNGYTPPYK